MSELEIYGKIAKATGFQYDEVAVIANSVAKGTTPTELAYFFNVAKTSGLNPFLKQIWSYKDHKGNLIIMAGRDGFLNIAQRNPRWNGMTSSEVYSNDHFEVDVINGIIEHKPNFKERGNLIGAYCYIRPKEIENGTFEYVNLKDYDKNQFIWNTHKNEMIKKVAEVHALKKAFGISGLYSEEEMMPDRPVIIEKSQPTDEEILQAIEDAKDGDDIKLILKQNPTVSMKSNIMNAIALKKQSYVK